MNTSNNSEQNNEVAKEIVQPENATVNQQITPTSELAEETPEEKTEENQPEKEAEATITLPETKDGIVEAMEKLVEQNDVPQRADVDALKQAFYKLKSAENNARKEQFVADGGNVEDYVAEQDPQEEHFKDLLNKIKDKRAKALEAEEKIKADNLAKKLQIIDSIKALTESSDDFNKLFKEFKDLQQKWNEIKLVPASEANNLWKSYQIYSEKFYDLVKINNEFRDYDFKKNMELKTQICESVEKLLEESDVVSAFYQLQNFHQQWREIGPVDREHREEVWERFKTASTEINKRYQAHFETLKEQEDTNLAEKTAICETLKAIDYSLLTSFKEWDEKSKEIIALQAKWKTIGFVPRKVNTQIFEEYRALCDKFFEKKAEFFKSLKDGMEANLEKKKALLEKAISLKDSTDWGKTTDEMIAIQREWKTIGAVPRKFSDAIWKEFVAACDYFFEQKKAANSSQKENEVNNLAKKKELIEKIKAIDVTSDAKQASDDLYAAIEEWRQIGFVPFKEKDKIYKEYQTALDEQFDKLKIDRSERKLQNFKSNIDDIAGSDKSQNKLYKEREKLIYQFNKIKSELQTYENNIGFLSVSKNSGGLLKDMNNKIEHLKDELDLITKKIETIETSINEPNQ
ncbi:DUF349 domain-containing protein [Dysgonomonas sp. 520]|uniref:DUF349 domain-containing protein n=1 Tax=Dysgonomonas sp. 520 TaxID=2302931 RepID=UPI0013CFEC51|nr:DUF349 domain-containing protein [Dysgonomonas sp. 520]